MTTSFNKQKHEYLIDGKKATGITTIIGVLAKPQLYSWYARMAVDYIKNSPVWRTDDETGNLYIGNKDFELILEEAKSAGNKKKEKAGEHGTDVHSEIERYILHCISENEGKPVAENPHFIHCGITQFIKWAYGGNETNEYGIDTFIKGDVDHFLFSERQMFNKDMFIAGTADFGAVMKDGKKLIGDFKTSSGVWGIDYFLQCAGYKILAEAEGDEPYDGCVIVRLGKDNSFDVHYRYDTKTDEEAFKACLTLYRAQATFTKPNN